MIPLRTIAAAMLRAVGPSPDDADDFSETVLAAALREHGASPLLVASLREALRVELAKAAT